MRISNSFSEGEVQVMDFMLQALLQGRNPAMATRHKEFASLCRKVLSMKTRMADKIEAKASSVNSKTAKASIANENSGPARSEADTSSVGQIEAIDVFRSAV